MTLSDLKRLFTYHPPTPEQAASYTRINEACFQAARVILEETPASPDQSDAIRSIRNARMTANAAIATQGPREAEPEMDQGK